jgi:DNA-binding HxlR family transcriptional regulator
VETVETNLETVVIEQPEETNTIVTDYATSSKQELIDALKLLINKEVDAAKDGVEHIKQLFYKKVKLEVEEQKKLFVENGGIETDFVAAKDELEESFKALLNEFRVKKASVMAQLEKEKDSNLLQKQHLLEQMKVLVGSNDDVSTHINEFRALQQKWKSIGQVPQTASTELWKQYNLYQESFWDLIKINNELREYDFKKNLESKTLLCDAAEKLSEETDVIAAFQKLQKLHEEWHELGPVAREIREQIWTRFKDASTAIHKKHQSYFDSIRKLEEENLVTKTELCEKIEAFDYSKLNNYRQWDEATKTILAWQEEWRSIGFAPRKVNQKVFDRYRKACDAFFAAKGEFYKETKNVLVVNSDKKKALCEQAEALKDSTDWKEAGEKFILLQKEWKTIGPVAKKYSDELWKRFIAACDYFFEQKNKSTSGQRNAESENLAKKKELIVKITAFEKSENNNESVAALRALMAEWNTIGHVPFKEKDKVYKEYRDAVDKQFETLNVDATNRRMDNFRSNLKDMSGKGENKLYREREKLMRAYEHLKSEILTYENNIGFFSSSSKKGGGLIKEMERKIESLKEESKLIEQKINLIDENI